MNKPNQQFNEILEAVHAGFTTVDERFALVDKRFDVVDKRFDAIIQQIDSRFTFVDKHFDVFEQRLSDLTGSVTELSAKMNSYLTQEWAVHLHDEHPRVEKRLRMIEQKLNINKVS